MAENNETGLQEEKTALLRKMLTGLERQKKSLLEEDFDLFYQLLEETDCLMEQVDRLEEKIAVFRGGGEKRGYAWQEEQRGLLIAIRELHRELASELLRQRSAVAGELVALKDKGKKLGVYREAPSVPEGAFLDKRK